MTLTDTSVSDTDEVKLSDAEFRVLRELVFQETSITLPDNRKQLLESRLRKRLRALNLTSYSDYHSYLQTHDPDGSELQQMINRVTTNKTDFFREEHHFQYLTDVVFPRLIREAQQNLRPKKLRIWSAACSTGEEPYTLSMIVQDTFGCLPDWDIRILASDIDTDVLHKAQSGIYNADKVELIPQHILRKHFLRGSGQSDGMVMVRPELGRLITFRQINFADEQWPVNAQFDVIFCRNVLIYFDNDTQDRLMSRFADYLAPDGSLFIGHSESLSRLSNLYTRVDKTVYEKTPSARLQQSAAQARTQSNTVSESSVAAGVVTSPHAGRTAVVSPATCRQHSIIVGEVFASERPVEVSTVLGSCIATCLYDPETGVGGMNHFALPSGNSDSRSSASFGVHAMELLINRIMRRGGDRRRLKAKVFGGANVMGGAASGSTVGQKNANFVRGFLTTESIPIEAEHLGGDCGIQVFFNTASGKVRLKLLDRQEAIAADEQIVTSMADQAPVDDITLF